MASKQSDMPGDVTINDPGVFHGSLGQRGPEIIGIPLPGRIVAYGILYTNAPPTWLGKGVKAPLISGGVGSVTLEVKDVTPGAPILPFVSIGDAVPPTAFVIPSWLGGGIIQVLTFDAASNPIPAITHVLVFEMPVDLDAIP